MIEQLLNVGGRQLLLPLLIAIGGLYAARGLFGLHGRMAQRRREFIELWTSERAHDDLWLQVVIRHLSGSYLPAPVIRKVMAWPDAAASLLAIAELWPMLTIDTQSQAVRWKRERHRKTRHIGIERLFMLMSFVVLATLALAAATISFRSDALSLPAITYAVVAVGLGLFSFVFLAHDVSLEVAYKRGPDLLARLNAPQTSAPPSNAQNQRALERREESPA